jgi:hypothetical protein
MSGLKAPRFLAAFFFLACPRAALVNAQQLEQPTPKPLMLRQSTTGTLHSDAGPIEIEHLDDFARRLLHHAAERAARKAPARFW